MKYRIVILSPYKSITYFDELTYEEVVEVLTMANLRILEDLEAKMKAIKAPDPLYIGRTVNDEDFYIIN